MIKKWFADNYKSSIEDVNNMIHQIGYVESKNNPSARQKSHVKDEDGNKMVNEEGNYVLKDGPAGGTYQFENKKGSGALQTALNRVENVYKNKKEKVPSWISEAREHDDASQLTVEQQDSLLLADLWQKSGSDDYINEALNTGDAKNLWLNKHWAGAKKGSEGYSKKAAQWNREMETYDAPFLDEDSKVISSLMKDI